jgi:cytochrome c553
MSSGLGVLDEDLGGIDIVDGAGGHSWVPLGKGPSRAVRYGDRAFVSLRGERAIAELAEHDGGWSVQRHIGVGAEPFGLVIVGDRLYVACGLEGDVEELDLVSGEVQRRFPIPGQPRWLAATEDRVYVASSFGSTVHVITLASGAIDAMDLAPPVLPETPGTDLRLTGDPLVTTIGTVVFPAQVCFTVISGVVTVGSGQPYYGDDLSPTRPVLVDVPEGGGPVNVTSLNPPAIWFNYPTAVAEDGGELVVGFEGSSVMTRVALVASERALSRDAPVMDRVPRVDNLTVVPGRGILARSRLDRAVYQLSDDKVLFELRATNLSASAARGRMLFFGADNPATAASGISCSSCHFEGRTDGLTWSIPNGKRQTMSLSERVAERSPLRWDGDRKSVAEDAMETSKLIGGTGLSEEQGRDIEAFLKTLAPPDVPSRAGEEELARGRQAFERAGCERCHGGALATDSTLHTREAGASILTPSLLGVAATPPYLHDGSVPTLSVLVERAQELTLGDTSMLSAEDKEALVRYLESL